MVSLKISKTLGLLRKLHNLLPRSALITIYKAFVRPYLDYGDILYDQAYSMSFHHKLESIQYNACLAITGAIRGTSKEKPNNYKGIRLITRLRVGMCKSNLQLSFRYRIYLTFSSPLSYFNDDTPS